MYTVTFWSIWVRASTYKFWEKHNSIHNRETVVSFQCKLSTISQYYYFKMTQQAKTKALGSLHQTLLSHYVVDFLGCTDQDTTQLKTLDVYKLPVVEIELYERCMQTLRAFSHLPYLTLLHLQFTQCVQFPAHDERHPSTSLLMSFHRTSLLFPFPDSSFSI